MNLICKLVKHLPEPGCEHCPEAEPPVAIGVNALCACDDLFLKPLNALKWRPRNAVWFVKRRRGELWFRNLMARVLMQAKTDRVYTNSWYRPPGVTELAEVNSEIILSKSTRNWIR